MRRGWQHFALTTLLVFEPACAKITKTSKVTLSPSEKPVLALTTHGGVISDRSYSARWVQLGDELVVNLFENRNCQALVHHPVVRTEKIKRTPDAMIAWELFLSAGATGISVFAFRNPASFGTRVTAEGDRVIDPKPSRRIGTSFAVGAGLLFFAGVYDIVRSIDRTVYTEAYQLKPGGPAPCSEPKAPLARHPVELVIGEHKISDTTSADGIVRFRLPQQSTLPKPPPSPLFPAAVRIDNYHAVAVDIRVPYFQPGTAHVGPRTAEKVELKPRTSSPQL